MGSPEPTDYLVNVVAKQELGTKRVCPTTGRKFYDLNRDPIVSPYTGEAFPRAMFEPQVKLSRTSPATAKDDEAPEIEIEEVDAELVTLEEADEDTSGRKRVEPATSDDDIDIDDDIVGADDDDDTFLADDEDDDDVSVLIDGDIEDDEEA